MNSASIPPKFSAASQVLRPLAAAASALLGLSALAIAVGWKERSAYYAELGAGWILGTVPVSSVIYAGSQPLLISAFGLCAGFLQFANGAASSVGLRRAAIATFFVGAGLVIFPPLFAEPASLLGVYTLARLGSVAVFLSVGLTIAEVIARFHEQNNRWHPYFLWLFYFSIIYGFAYVPSQAAIAEARLDVSAKHSTLPVVETGDSHGANSVRLVAVNGEQAILVSLADEAKRATFRVMSVRDVKVIRSTRTPR